MRPEDKELYEFLFKEDEVPKGYYSINEIAKATGITISSAYTKMKRLVQQNKAETLSVKTPVDGRLRQVTVYKING